MARLSKQEYEKLHENPALHFAGVLGLCFMVSSLLSTCKELHLNSTILLLLPLDFFFADLICGLNHYLCDLVLPAHWMFVRDFHTHHNDPMACTKNSYLKNIWVEGAAAFPLTITTKALLPATLSFHVLVALLVASQNEQIHAWAHTPQKLLPFWVRGLQRNYLLLSPAHHKKHHHTFSSNFGTVNGWSDPIIDLCHKLIAWVKERAVFGVTELRFLRVMLWRLIYNAAARLTWDVPNTDFMNWGYLSLSETGQGEDSDEDSTPLGARMYERAAKPLLQERLGHQGAGKTYHATTRLRILEIGCGRGSGLAHLKEKLTAEGIKFDQLIGLDLAEQNVKLAEKLWHRHASIDFVQGNAEDLPFGDASFDAIVNVESSHCYPNIDKFFGEVRRVLKPGGVFCYADFRRTCELQDLFEELKAKLLVHEKAYVTQEVLYSCKRDSKQREDLLAYFPALTQPWLRNILCLHGSDMYKGFADREFEYFVVSAAKAN